MLCQLTEERFHLGSTKRTIQADGENRIGLDTGEEGFKGLSAQRTSRQVTHRHRQHDGQFLIQLYHHLHGCIDSHLRIQGIEDRLYQQDIHTTLDQCTHLFLVGTEQLIIGQLSCGRVTHIG